jgi:hypothetical protein
MIPSPSRVAALFRASRQTMIPLIESVRTPRMGEIYDVEVYGQTLP